MATITEAQLYVLVGEELGIISGNNPLQPDDADKIARRSASVRGWLIEEGLIYFPLDSIPDAASLPLAQILAGKCADLFARGPKSEDPYTNGPVGFAELERHVSKRSAKEPVKFNTF